MMGVRCIGGLPATSPAAAYTETDRGDVRRMRVEEGEVAAVVTKGSGGSGSGGEGQPRFRQAEESRLR